MPKPPSTPRLANLDPSAVALATARRAYSLLTTDVTMFFGSRWRVEPEGLEMNDATFRKTTAYRTLLNLGAYARGTEALHEDLEPALRRVGPLLARLLDLSAGTTAELLEQVERIAEQSELGLLVAAAAARARLDANRPLSSADVAVLAGRSRMHITNLIRDGVLKAKLLERAPGEGRRKERYQISAAETRKLLRAEQEATE